MAIAETGMIKRIISGTDGVLIRLEPSHIDKDHYWTLDKSHSHFESVYRFLYAAAFAKVPITIRVMGNAPDEIKPHASNKVNYAYIDFP